MKGTLKRVSMILLLPFLFTIGCGNTSKSSSKDSIIQRVPHQNNGLLPVKYLVPDGKLKPLTSLVSSKKIHSVVGFPQAIVQGVNVEGFFAPVWDNNGNDPNLISKYTDGLYFVSSKTSSISKTIFENAKQRQQVNKAVSNKDWLVWVEGRDDDTGPYRIMAKNMSSNKTDLIYQLPTGYETGNQPSLNLDGDYLYWSNFIQNNKTIISQVVKVDLQSNVSTTLVKYTVNRSEHTLSNKGIINSSTFLGKKVAFSVFESGDVRNTAAKGYIDTVDPSNKSISRVLTLYHVADQLAGDRNSLVFTTNYSEIPNGPDNGGPYPIFLYHLGDNILDQVTATHAAVGFPSISGNYITWFGGAGDPQLYDRKTHTYYSIDGVGVKVFGNTLFWNNGKRIYWCMLPGNS